MRRLVTVSLCAKSPLRTHVMNDEGLRPHAGFAAGTLTLIVYRRHQGGNDGNDWKGMCADRRGYSVSVGARRSNDAVRGMLTSSTTMGPTLLGAVRVLCAISAKNETARLVLLRILSGTGRTLTWRLLYDGGLKVYALNIAVVANPTAPIAAAGATTSQPATPGAARRSRRVSRIPWSSAVPNCDGAIGIRCAGVPRDGRRRLTGAADPRLGIQ